MANKLKMAIADRVETTWQTGCQTALGLANVETTSRAPTAIDEVAEGTCEYLSHLVGGLGRR